MRSSAARMVAQPCSWASRWMRISGGASRRDLRQDVALALGRATQIGQQKSSFSRSQPSAVNRRTGGMRTPSCQVSVAPAK